MLCSLINWDWGEKSGKSSNLHLIVTLIRFIKPGTWAWALIHKHAFKVQRKWNTPMYWFHIEPNRRINLVWWLVFIFRTHTLSQQTQVRTHINNNTHDNELDTHSTNKHQSLLPRDETLKQYEWANMIHYTNTTLNSCFGYQFIRATIRTCMCVLLFFLSYSIPSSFMWCVVWVWVWVCIGSFNWFGSGRGSMYKLQDTSVAMRQCIESVDFFCSVISQ